MLNFYKELNKTYYIVGHKKFKNGNVTLKIPHYLLHTTASHQVYIILQ